MPHALSLEELMKTTKTELLSPEELAADGMSLRTGDFELVDAADLAAPAPAPERRPQLSLVAARPEPTPAPRRGHSVATLSGSVPIVIPPYVGETVRLPRVDGPHPQNRRVNRTPRRTMIIPRTPRPSPFAVAERLLASAWRVARRESRQSALAIRGETMKLPLVLALVAAAFLLGALAVHAGGWLTP